MTPARDLDIVIYGATGFVGRLTAEYLAAHAPAGARIGLGGRTQAKLEAVRGDLGVDWPLVVADSGDERALAEMAGRARVVATTVGPYGPSGRPLVEACAQAGTHYADLSGEVLFMRAAIDRHHETARGTGARIVHAAGFDSIPSDLGVMAAHAAARRDGAGALEDTTMVVTGLRGGISGGTIASMRGQLLEMQGDKAHRRTILDPYALSPDRGAEPDLGPQRELQRPARDPELGWLAPFVMASINTRVVRRSNALQDWAYGRRFRYREVMRAGGGPLAPAMAGAVTAGLGALAAGLSFGPTRSLLDRILPSPGEGPSRSTREKGYFAIEVHARTSTGRKYVARVKGKGDPGYAATAVMFGEAALCLALDGDDLPGGGGVLTPATAMGETLAQRLRAAGLTIEAGPSDAR